MRFQIYDTKDPITLTQYRKIKTLSNIYVPYIDDMQELNTYVYVLDFQKDQTVQRVKDMGVNIEPSYVVYSDETKHLQYVEEFEVKKFIDKVNMTRELEVGAFVTLKEFHELPFEVIGNEDHLVTLQHKVNNLNLTLTVKDDRCNRIDKDKKIVLYKQIQIPNPVSKIFVDCDMYSSELKLMDDLLALKTVYKHYKVYLINPMGYQVDLGGVLGLSSVYGNKFKVIGSNVYEPSLDFIYSDDMNFLRFEEKMMHLEYYHNIGMPEIIYKKDSVIEFSDTNKSMFLKGCAIKAYIKDIQYKELDYYKIKEFFEFRGMAKYIEDIPYYIQLIKR